MIRQPDNGMRVVILHNARRVEIPKEFAFYYTELGLLLNFRRWPKIYFLRHDLKAKVDKVNGGMRFWTKHLEPIVAYANESSLSSFYEAGGAMYTNYDSLQTAYRESRQTMRCKGCGGRIQGEISVSTGLCEVCRRKNKAWKQIQKLASSISVEA